MPEGVTLCSSKEQEQPRDAVLHVLTVQWRGEELLLLASVRSIDCSWQGCRVAAAAAAAATDESASPRLMLTLLHLTATQGETNLRANSVSRTETSEQVLNAAELLLSTRRNSRPVFGKFTRQIHKIWCVEALPEKGGRERHCCSEAAWRWTAGLSCSSLAPFKVPERATGSRQQAAEHHFIHFDIKRGRQLRNCDFYIAFTDPVRRQHSSLPSQSDGTHTHTHTLFVGPPFHLPGASLAHCSHNTSEIVVHMRVSPSLQGSIPLAPLVWRFTTFEHQSESFSKAP